MINKFIPNVYQADIWHINYDKLKKNGIELLVFDLDNTIGIINDETPSDQITDLFNNLTKDFQILVASNNNEKRVKTFCINLPCKYLFFSCKPLKRITHFIKKHYDLSMNQVAIIGDQLVTDIFLGNRSGMLTILVDPLGNTDLKVTAFNRYIEGKIKNRIKFKKGEYYEKD